MTVSLSEVKVNKVKGACVHILESPDITIQTLAEVIGQLVATQPAIWIAPLFYKRLETLKNESLRLCKGNYSAHILFNEEARADLKWWLDNLDGFVTPVKRTKTIFRWRQYPKMSPIKLAKGYNLRGLILRFLNKIFSLSQ